MRVFIGIDSLGLGGKERQAAALIKGLETVPDVDCRVVCFGADRFYLDDVAKPGASVTFVPRRARWDPGVFRKLRSLIKSHRPDVIHTNGLVSSFYCLPFARLWRIPLINGSIRNAFTADGPRWTVERLLLAASDYRVANSRAGLRSRGLAEEDSRNVVLYNGFDFGRLGRLDDGDARASVRPERNMRTVGMVAEFNPYKDYRTFIEAARILSQRRPDVTFVAVGDGATLDACKAAAEGLPTVTFLGRRSDVEQLVAAFDVGVLCTFGEGLSNSIMEYMALGKPVVATDGGGTRELVADGETGFVVGERDAAALAAAVERLIEHPDLALRMGRAGRAKLRREFSLARMIEETVALYARAASGARGPITDAP